MSDNEEYCWKCGAPIDDDYSVDGVCFECLEDEDGNDADDSVRPADLEE